MKKKNQQQTNKKQQQKNHTQENIERKNWKCNKTKNTQQHNSKHYIKWHLLKFVNTFIIKIGLSKSKGGLPDADDCATSDLRFIKYFKSTEPKNAAFYMKCPLRDLKGILWKQHLIVIAEKLKFDYTCSIPPVTNNLMHVKYCIIQIKFQSHSGKKN